MFLLIFAIDRTRKQSGFVSFLLFFLFSLGKHGIGTSWVYESFVMLGEIPNYMMVVLIVLYLIANSLLFSVVMIVANLVVKRITARGRVNLSSVSVLVGWICYEISTLLVSFDLAFPWLLLGYSLIETWLAGFAPVGGVLLVSLMALLIVVGIYEVGRTRAASVLLIGAPWIVGAYLSNVEWTRPYDEVKVAMVQSNVTQTDKLLESRAPPEDRPRDTSLVRHTRITADIEEDVDWIIWPESAIPFPITASGPNVEYLQSIADHVEATLIVGTFFGMDFRDGRREVYNAALAFEEDSEKFQYYLKIKLVPFGEYVPFRFLFEWIGETLDIPLSIVASGSDQQEPFELNDVNLSVSICYEIAFPTVVVQRAHDSAIIATISEDGWFGRTIAPHQHMQIARMRALETGKYLLRTTSSGITGIVNPKGRLVKTVPTYEAHVLIETVPLIKDNTPYSNLMNSYVVELLFEHIFAAIFGSFAILGILTQLLLSGRKANEAKEEALDEDEWEDVRE